MIHEMTDDETSTPSDSEEEEGTPMPSDSEEEEAPKIPKKTKTVFSFDFDGCLSHDQYQQAYKAALSDETNSDPSGNLIITHNQTLLDSDIKNGLMKDKDPTDCLVINNSNRQDEEMNARQSQSVGGESCFLAAQKIATHLGINLETLLLADIYNNLAIGTSFDKAVDPNYKGKHLTSKADKTKVTIILAQIYYLADKYPGEQIDFHMFEDTRDNLDAVWNFLNTHTAFRHPNVTMHFHVYEEGHLSPNYKKPLPAIEENVIPTDYRRIVKNLYTLARNVTWNKRGQVLSGPLDVAKWLNDPACRNQLPALILGKELLSPHKKEGAKAQLDKFEEQLNTIIGRKALLFSNDAIHLETIGKDATKYRCAQIATENLHKGIKREFDNYVLGAIDPATFQTNCFNHIKVARRELEHHRDMKNFWANLGLAVAGLGVFYGVAVLIHRARSKHNNFLFFQTDAEKKLNQFEHVVEEMVAAAAASA